MSLKIHYISHIFIIVLLFVLLVQSSSAQTGSENEPVRYTGVLPDQTYSDGRLPQIVGVENIQVFRANRTHPDLADGFGWTYNHAPMLTYWNGKFYLEYLSNPVGEHVPPGQTLISSSIDGREWSKPVVVFPPYKNPNVIMHQRMGFYIAPNNRLLLIGCYAVNPKPNEGHGIGRVVREVHIDGSMGPIYFVRIHMHNGWDESNVDYPFYTKSQNNGFVEACDSLLADKLITLQWYEEDQGKDGFFEINTQETLKALSYYHRKDGKVVGLWKKAMAILSSDEGKSWSEPVQLQTVPPTNAKIWGQKIEDGNYVLALCPTKSDRYPLCLSLSNDGINFEQFHIIHDELPIKRFGGKGKNNGPQYVRGIVEGNGNPPGSDLWLTYSVSKEDIWVSRIPVPIRFEITKHAQDHFDGLDIGEDLSDWSLYKPFWAQIFVADNPKGTGKCLMLEDEDPYDYSRAVRHFPKSHNVHIEFSVIPAQNNLGRLEIEVLGERGERTSFISFNNEGIIEYSDGCDLMEVMKYNSFEELKLSIELNCIDKQYTFEINDDKKISSAKFIEDVEAVQRLLFRTGEYRGIYPVIDKMRKEDLPQSDEPTKKAIFYIDDIVTN